MKICQRKNRKTKHIVELHRERRDLGAWVWIDWYWCRCAWHDVEQSPKHSCRTDVLRSMAHPDEWCAECKVALNSPTGIP